MLYGESSRKIPVRYTSTIDVINQTRETEKIKLFIRVSIGATALRTSTSTNNPPVTMLSRTYALKLDPNRPLLLLVLPALTLLNAALLVFWNARLHRQAGTPCYQQAKLSEILMFSQSDDTRNTAELAWRSNEFDPQQVRFERDERMLGLCILCKLRLNLEQVARTTEH